MVGGLLQTSFIALSSSLLLVAISDLVHPEEAFITLADRICVFGARTKKAQNWRSARETEIPKNEVQVVAPRTYFASHHRKKAVGRTPLTKKPEKRDPFSRT